jgi:hypothetical protein
MKLRTTRNNAGSLRVNHVTARHGRGVPHWKKAEMNVDEREREDGEGCHEGLLLARETRRAMTESCKNAARVPDIAACSISIRKEPGLSTRFETKYENT